MDAEHRAAAGIGLCALAYLGFAPLALGFVGVGPFLAGVVLAGLGLLLAAAGLAGLRAGRGLPLLGTGFAVAAVGGIAVLLFDLGQAGLFLVPHALMALGLAQAAWYALLWWLGAGDRGPREARALAVTCWVLAAGFLGYLALVVANGFLDVVVQEAAGLTGAVLAARSLPPAARTLAAAADAVSQEDLEGLREPVPRQEPHERIG